MLRLRFSFRHVGPTVMALVALALVVTSLAGCAAPTPTPAPKPQPTTAPVAQPTAVPPTAVPPTKVPPTAAPQPVELNLVWYGPTPAEKAEVEGAIARFQILYPHIKVNLNHIPDSRGWQDKVQVMIAGGSAPDMSQMTFAVYGDWARAGTLADLSPFIAADKDGTVDKFLPNNVDLFKVKGKLYGLGYSWNVMSLYYNKDMFDAAKVAYPPADADKAWSWDKFVEVAQQLTIDKNGKHPNEAGFDKDNVKQWGVYAQHIDFNFMPLVWSNGGDWFSPDGSKATFNDPAVVDAMQKYIDLEAKYRVSPTGAAVQGTGMNAYQLVQQGRVAMFPFGTWSTSQFAGKPFKWGVAPLPIMQKPATWINPDSMVIYSASKHPQEAWLFVKYWVSEENQLIQAKSGRVMPTLKSLYTPEGYAKWLNPEVRPADYGESIAAYTMKYGRLPSYPPGYSKIWSGIVSPALDAAWAGTKTVKQAIDPIMADVDKALKDAAK